MQNYRNKILGLCISLFVFNFGGFAIAASVISPKLSYSFSGNGKGTVSFDTSGGTSCGTNTKCSSYPLNSLVTLTAVPSPGSDFISWTGCATSTGTQCTVTLTANTIVKPKFALYPKLNIISTTNRGTVTSPTSIDLVCGTACTLSKPIGTVINLFESAKPGYYFSSWRGGGCSGQTCSVTMSNNQTVYAVFLPEKVTPLAIGSHVNVVEPTKQ